GRTLRCAGSRARVRGAADGHGGGGQGQRRRPALAGGAGARRRNARLRGGGGRAAPGLPPATRQPGGRTAPGRRRQGRRHRRPGRGAAVPRAHAGVRRRRPDRRARLRGGQRVRRDQRAGGRPPAERGPVPPRGHRGGACLAAAGGGRMNTSNLDLGLVGNGSVAMLVDRQARVSWGCIPAFDGDPAFCALMEPTEHAGGGYAIELNDFDHAEEEYVENTAILRTVLHDTHGASVEVTDFCPRWRQYDRWYRPVMLLRRVRPLSGTPRIRVRVRPLADWGATRPDRTWGSNH